MHRVPLWAVAASVALVQPTSSPAQTRRYPLESASGLRLVNVAAAPAVLDGKKGLRVTISEEGARNVQAMTPDQQATAFRLQNDMQTYDAFYLRPTNGRAEDQERRNHAAQYVSHPEWPWFRLRRETPSKYEAYVDLVPGQWTPIRIEVQGNRARLFVHGEEQPTLIVNDVKTGTSGKGAVALWIGPGTIAHFRDVRVRALAGEAPK